MLPCMSFRTIELFVFWASFVGEFIKIFQVLDTRYVFVCFAVSSSYLCSFMTSNRIPSLYCLCSLFFFLSDLLSLLHRSPFIRCYLFFFQSFPLPQGFSCSKIPKHYTTFHWCRFHHLRSLVQKSRSSVRSDDTFINLK